jgi:hypothetical protein
MWRRDCRRATDGDESALDYAIWQAWHEPAANIDGSRRESYIAVMQSVFMTIAVAKRRRSRDTARARVYA